LIEVEEVIEPAYTMEVSSPGLNRVLKKEKDFIKFSGKKICVQCHAPLNGRKKFTGILTDFKNQSIHLEVDGQLQTISINRVAKANLVIEI
jgi:ribosome maturation factor RimP